MVVSALLLDPGRLPDGPVAALVEVTAQHGQQGDQVEGGEHGDADHELDQLLLVLLLQRDLHTDPVQGRDPRQEQSHADLRRRERERERERRRYVEQQQQNMTNTNLFTVAAHLHCGTQLDAIPAVQHLLIKTCRCCTGLRVHSFSGTLLYSLQLINYILLLYIHVLFVVLQQNYSSIIMIILV